MSEIREVEDGRTPRPRVREQPTRPVAHVRFTSVDEWLVELRLQLPDLVTPWVRCCIHMAWDRNGLPLQSIIVVAGFRTRDEFVELRSFCGERMQGGPDDVGRKADGMRERIAAECKQLGVELRGGAYQSGKEG